MMMRQQPRLLLALALVALLFPACRTTAVVDDDVQMERVSSGHTFTEGPAWDGEQYIYFTDIPNDLILRYNVRTDETDVFREDSGGANGLRFDREGRLVVCEGGNRRVTRIHDDGAVEVLAEQAPTGERLNSPNDLDVDPRGGIYFTDPRYGDRDDMELDVEAVYYITPEGELKELITDLQRPNGLILSLDYQTLYVADEAGKTIYAYDVQDDGTLTNGWLFAAMNPDEPIGGDGMTLDEHGNLYCAGYRDIWVWNPEGELLHWIETPEGPANLTFGGPDNRDLYVTATTSLYRIRMNVRGGR